MTTPLGTFDVTAREGRRVTVARQTRETDVAVTLDLDGTGATDVRTGVGFLDHLLTSFAHHGLFDLAVRATGDLDVDEHHTVEDVALVLGTALGEALGDRAGIARFGEASIPMDEAIATAVVDVGGRPYAVVDLPFRGERDRCAPDPARRARARGVRPRLGHHAARCGEPAGTTITWPRPRSRRSPAPLRAAVAEDPRRAAPSRPRRGASG